MVIAVIALKLPIAAAAAVIERAVAAIARPDTQTVQHYSKLRAKKGRCLRGSMLGNFRDELPRVQLGQHGLEEAKAPGQPRRRFAEAGHWHHSP